MPGDSAVLERERSHGVGRKRKDDDSAKLAVQKNIRLSKRDADRIDRTAAALGLDEANFLRMLIKAHLPVYERQADAIREQEPPGH